MKRLTVLAVIALAFGCSKKKDAETTPPPPPVAEPAPAAPVEPPAPASTEPMSEAEFQALMNQALAMFNAMGDAVDKAGGDCGKLADALDKVMDDHQDFIDRVKSQEGETDLDRRSEAWMKDHQDEVMAPMMKLAGAGQKCATDAKFMAVMERLETMGD